MYNTTYTDVSREFFICTVIIYRKIAKYNILWYTLYKVPITHYTCIGIIIKYL